MQLVDGSVLSVTDWDEGVKTVGYWGKKMQLIKTRSGDDG